MVEEPAEGERGEAGAQVEPRVNEAEHLAGGARRRGRPHQHVARGPGRPVAETGEAEHHREQGRRQRARGQQHHEPRRGDQPRDGHDIVPARAIGQEPSRQDAGRAAHQESGERPGGQPERRFVDAHQGGDAEGLHADERGGDEGEVGERGQDRRGQEQAHLAPGRAPRPLRRAAAHERAELGRQQPDHGQPHGAHRHQRDAPAEVRGEADHHRRCRRPAEIAGDRVHAVPAPDPPRVDRRVQDRVVGGMEHTVAEPGQQRHR